MTSLRVMWPKERKLNDNLNTCFFAGCTGPVYLKCLDCEQLKGGKTLQKLNLTSRQVIRLNKICMKLSRKDELSDFGNATLPNRFVSDSVTDKK